MTLDSKFDDAVRQRVFATEYDYSKPLPEGVQQLTLSPGLYKLRAFGAPATAKAATLTAFSRDANGYPSNDAIIYVEPGDAGEEFRVDAREVWTFDVETTGMALLRRLSR